MGRITEYDFDAAYSHLIDVYGIEMNEDDFESMAYVAWLRIGNKVCRTYRAEIHPEYDEKTRTWSAFVPCNCDIIEAITSHFEDYKSTSNINNYINTLNSVMEQNIESTKVAQPANYQSGGLVRYERVGDKLYFGDPYPSLTVVYKGVYLDDEGLPKLNYKEVDAIATYCAYVVTFKKSLKSMDANAALMAAVLKQEWERKCAQARVPEFIDQNEMDHILDAHSSWNRKIYGQSYKVDMR